MWSRLSHIPESFEGQVVDLRLSWTLALHIVVKVKSYLKSHGGQVDLRLNRILDLHLMIKVKSYLKS